MLVLIVMIISIALLLALFSGFFPFVNTYGNVMQYTTAYYGAVSALERGALAVRYAGPGFDGESGWIAGTGNVGKMSDQKVLNFYTYGNWNDTLFWKVRSSTDRIPALGHGDVDIAFIKPDNQDSKNFNALHYSITELLPLWTIGSLLPEQYYDFHQDFSLRPGTEFTLNWHFRLNPFLFQAFSGGHQEAAKLCYDQCPGSLDNDRRDRNQVVATWTLKGKYDDEEYTLLPTDGTSLGKFTVEPRDTLIRKERVNEEKPMMFWNNVHPFDPLSVNASLNIVSNYEGELKNLSSFWKILTDPHVKNSYLTFTLSNFLWSQGGNFWRNLYPFLEYAFETVNGEKIADRFYTIQGQGKVGQYDVKLQLKKPTLEQPALGNFTIIF